MKRPFVEEVFLHLKAGYSFLSVNTAEEARCSRELVIAGWRMGDGRRVKLSAVNKFINDSKYKPDKSLIEGDEFKVNVDYMIDVKRRMEIEDDERSAIVTGVLNTVGYPVVSWNLIDGFDGLEGLASMSLEEAIQEILKYDSKSKGRLPKNCIVVIKDAHELINHADQPTYRRHIRNMYEENRITNPTMRRHVVLLQPDWQPHRDIAHCIANIDFSPPDEAQLDSEISFTELSLAGSKSLNGKCDASLRPLLITSLRGLTTTEAGNALAMSVVARKGFVPEMITDIHRTKSQMLKSDEVLEYVDSDYLAGTSDIGGYENYFDFLAECQVCYSKEARAAGLKRPKGALLLGVPGTGKSLVAMATAKFMKIPLVKFDFGAVFGGIVGESETKMRRSLRRIQALGPCVLMVDEADKAFSGITQSSGDSGVGQRVFMRLLTWMALENEEAFMIMTMNRLQGVPIEMLRAGRLDATFYTAIPDPGQREDILRIHFRKNNINADSIRQETWETLVEQTEDYVGSELEQIAVRAARMSFKARGKIEPTEEELLAARAGVNPVSKLDEKGIEAIMAFCEGKATNVSRESRKLPMGRRKRSISTEG